MFVPADEHDSAETATTVTRDWPVSAGVLVTAAVTVMLSVYPQPLLHLADLAARSL